jgi:membrane associated rhomboid family serine protease
VVTLGVLIRFSSDRLTMSDAFAASGFIAGAVLMYYLLRNEREDRGDDDDCDDR